MLLVCVARYAAAFLKSFLISVSTIYQFSLYPNQAKTRYVQLVWHSCEKESIITYIQLYILFIMVPLSFLIQCLHQICQGLDKRGKNGFLVATVFDTVIFCFSFFIWCCLFWFGFVCCLLFVGCFCFVCLSVCFCQPIFSSHAVLFLRDFFCFCVYSSGNVIHIGPATESFCNWLRNEYEYFWLNAPKIYGVHMRQQCKI